MSLFESIIIYSPFFIVSYIYLYEQKNLYNDYINYTAVEFISFVLGYSTYLSYSIAPERYWNDITTKKNIWNIIELWKRETRIFNLIKRNLIISQSNVLRFSLFYNLLSAVLIGSV